MSFHFRPPQPENTPVIVGLAGPTKSGKTYSALRLATGMANGGSIAMINAEGARGHLYRTRFTYLATDIQAPFRPARYSEAVKAALDLDPKPAVVIIDSMSHMHDGPGGMLEYHEEEIDRLLDADKRNNQRERQKKTWTAWIAPKADENEFIYTLLAADCHFVLCFRAKKKLQIVTGQEPKDLGWQPIASDRVSFETMFTVVLPPHSKGVPDLAASEMREPFDELIPKDKAMDEGFGRTLAAWSREQSGKPAVAPVVDEEILALNRTLVDLAGQLDAEPDFLKRVEQRTQAGDKTWLKQAITRAETKLAGAVA